MKSEYKIIDNLLPTPIFRDILDCISSNIFPWYHHNEVAYTGSWGEWADEMELTTSHLDQELLKKMQEEFSVPLTEEQKEYNHHLIHKVYQDYKMLANNATWDKIQPIISKLDIKALIRIKINYYPKTHKLIHHPYHIDYAYKHKGAVFYLNENDGLTVLEDGTEIKSIPNRMLLLDTSKPHHSTTTTNADRRLVMNINWM